MSGAECLFCKIIEKKVTAIIVHEDESSLAFRDINPQAPTHILIVPKKHMDDLRGMNNADREGIGHLFLVAQQIAEKLNLLKNGYRMVINNGRDAGQTVSHVHVHLLAGRRFSWPPG
jgi:histidine triad (HIT) family protein